MSSFDENMYGDKIKSEQMHTLQQTSDQPSFKVNQYQNQTFTNTLFGSRTAATAMRSKGPRILKMADYFIPQSMETVSNNPTSLVDITHGTAQVVISQ